MTLPPLRLRIVRNDPGDWVIIYTRAKEPTTLGQWLSVDCLSFKTRKAAREFRKEHLTPPRESSYPRLTKE